MFSVGNFIEYGANRVARIDGIFVHELTRVRRLFVRISEVDLAHNDTRDIVLDLPKVTFSGKVSIIGLPLVNERRLYVIPINNELVWVDWTLQFL